MRPGQVVPGRPRSQLRNCFLLTNALRMASFNGASSSALQCVVPSSLLKCWTSLSKQAIEICKSDPKQQTSCLDSCPTFGGGENLIELVCMRDAQQIE
jgi:hypothetical protein